MGKKKTVVLKMPGDSAERIKQLQEIQQQIGLSEFIFLGTLPDDDGGHMYLATELAPVEVLDLLLKCMNTLLRMDYDFSDDVVPPKGKLN